MSGWQGLFWCAVALVVYTFGGYPVLIGLLARRVRSLRPADGVRTVESDLPSVAVLIPAYNEEAVIAAKIENSLALTYPPDRLEVVVVSDGSDDGTPEIVARYADRGVRLYHQPERRGKMAAINRVMPLLTTDIVVMTDANAMVTPGALQAIVPHFADPTVAGVAGEKRVLGGGEGLYWRYESFLKRCDSVISSVMGAAGELFAIRRERFEPPPANTLLDDFVISLRLVEQGYRVVYEPAAVAIEPPSPSMLGDWRRRVRIAAGGIQSICWLPGLMSPRRGRIAWQYISHRVLRWLVTPFLLPIIYGTNLILCGQPFYRLLLWGQTGFYLAALVGYVWARQGTPPRLLQAIFYFCFTNLAAIVGFWRYVTNRQPVTWEKAR